MTLKLKPEDALHYHRHGRPGKLEVVSTKPCRTQRDLSLAYTPGVAEVCRAIVADPDAAFDYTARGNLVAVITNGTAVLGLGDIGPLAGKPVMEGKAVLFKRFADVDVFDIEVAERDPERFVEIVAALEPTFGGINLEDVKAPECFAIEEALIERLEIPVFHDDQHGTAIISAAALINAVEIAGKRIEELRKVVVSGAGAASIGCLRLFRELGLPRESIWMYDSKGLVHAGRTDLNRYKAEFARPEPEDVPLAEAMRGADLFLGVSVGGLLTSEMIRSMAENPIVFAMANPDPEIAYPDAVAARPDVIMATGRSDFPNQVNNVLGFPFIFRGALDVRAKRINSAMKLAAARALAALAKETVPENVIRAYGNRPIAFGREYIIPKPFDHRVLLWVAPAVAKAAMETGVARQPITDFDAYRSRLEALLAPARQIIRTSINRSRSGKALPRVVFAEGDEEAVLKAVETAIAEGFVEPILVGPPERIRRRIRELGLNLEGVTIVDQFADPEFERYVEDYWARHHRDGITRHRAERRMQQRLVFAAQMVADGRADILVGGFHKRPPEVLAVTEDILGLQPGVPRPVGVSAVVYRQRLFLFADTGVTVDPTPEELVNIAKRAVEGAAMFEMDPRVAFISFASFGAHTHPEALKMRRAVELLDTEPTGFVYDGEMTVDAALDGELRQRLYPRCRLDRDANILVFPNLSAAHAATRLLATVGGAEILGPVYRGFTHPVVILNPSIAADEIYNLVGMAAGQLAAMGLNGVVA